MVLLNLPQPGLYPSPSHFLSFCDALVQRLDRVLLIRVTITRTTRTTSITRILVSPCPLPYCSSHPPPEHTRLTLRGLLHYDTTITHMATPMTNQGTGKEVVTSFL